MLVSGCGPFCLMSVCCDCVFTGRLSAQLLSTHTHTVHTQQNIVGGKLVGSRNRCGRRTSVNLVREQAQDEYIDTSTSYTIVRRQSCTLYFLPRIVRPRINWCTTFVPRSVDPSGKTEPTLRWQAQNNKVHVEVWRRQPQIAPCTDQVTRYARAGPSYRALSTT